MSLFRQEVIEGRKDRLHGEVVISQSTSNRVLSIVLFVTIAIAAVWLTTGTYARIETVPGILVTDVASARVVSQQSGTVAELAVAEGLRVEKGDPLLVVNLERQAATGGAVAERGLGAIDARRQLSEAQVLLARQRAEAERNRLASVVASAEQQAASLRNQIALQEKTVASNEEMFEQSVEVVNRGFMTKVEFERRRQAILGSQQQLAALRERLALSEGEAGQARAQMASVSIDAEQGVSQIRDGLQALSAEEARLEGEQSFVITAPIAGRVTAFDTGLGRPALAGRALMVIVPDEAQLSAELFAPSRAIGFVEPGKETRLLYDAFPYQRFGSFGGKVSSVSRTAIDPRETEIPFQFEEPIYRVRVKLDQQDIAAYGERVALQPGMTLQANVILERQSFLAWLLQPLNAVLRRNG